MKKKQVVSLSFAVLSFTLIPLVSVQGVEQNNYYLKGDVNGDGKVNIRDVTAIQRDLADCEPATEDMLIRAKVTGGESLTISDATAIQMYLAEYDDPYSIGQRVFYGNPDERFAVTFYDYDETTVLSSQEVSYGETATLPENPTKQGVSFLGWSGKYDNVTQNESVRAVYSDEKNVFIVSPSDISASNTVNVLVRVNGVVKTSGFDFNLYYDSNLELVSYDDDLDLDIVVTPKPAENRIRLNFSSSTDRERQRDIIQLTFKIKDVRIKNLPVSISMNSIKELYNNNPVNTNYVLVNGLVNS